MAASVETTPSPKHSNKKGTSLMNMASSELLSPASLSPSSDKRLWSNLRNRIDVLLEEKLKDQKPISNSPLLTADEKSKRFKNDSMLLLKGFDSVSHTLSQLSSNLDNALQGVRELAKPPTLSEILHSNLKAQQIQQHNEEKEEEDESKCKKRKHDEQKEEEEEEDKIPKERNVMKRAKMIAISMASKANSLAKELKSIKSGLSFIQERCGLLEEENKRLRDGFVKGVRPEEDDLVRLQLEVLLAEKARLANENANLIRENQCLHQVVEYHQITSQDLSDSYEQVEDVTEALDVSKSLYEIFQKIEDEDEEKH